MLLSRAVKMLRTRMSAGVLAACTVLGTCLLPAMASAAVYTVKRDGTGDFATIQACADAARAGDTCDVYAGIYNEHVRTTAGGTGDTTRITFKVQGVVTMQGFDIRHPFVSVEGFDITGYSVSFQGLITIYDGGDNCRVLNNTLRDGAAQVYGIYFYISAGQSANNCTVRGNRLSNLLANFLTTAGENHLFDSNVLEYQNSMDFIRLFGANLVFRRNVFHRGTTRDGTGNHPDFVQTFGGASLRSENHLFEENWIQDLSSQFGQVNSGDGVVTKGILYGNIKNITFRRNVIISVSNNANIGMPGMRFENNTFYRMAHEMGGIYYGGSLTRGDAPNGSLRNNVFLEGGFRAANVGDSAGFYAVTGHVLSREVIGVFVTNDATVQTAVTTGIYDDLRANGYIDPNGKVLAKAIALTSVAQLVLSAQYESFRANLYDVLIRTVQMDQALRSTFIADYNYVAGAASAGYPAKRSSGCNPLLTFTDGNFCEAHGINGGDPRLQNLANPLGPDGLPFTIDDGLKPLPTSPLCSKGEGGTDIGAYSCDPTKVFPNPGLRPGTPTNVRIVGQ
jgi:hypothetical protein